MRVAMLAPISWRVPPRHYGPWERVVSLLTEGLVERGVEVTLFATADSVTQGKLDAVCPRPLSEDASLDPKVWEALHIANAFAKAERFDLLHNHYDFLPLTYTGLVSTPVVTTIHGFSSDSIRPVFRRYDRRVAYVSISDADRDPDLHYLATVHHGIDLSEFTPRERPGRGLVCLGRIHPDKGVAEAIAVAKAANLPLVIAGIVHDPLYFEREVAPHLDGDRVRYVGSVTPAERDELLGSARALLHLVEFAEPFGLSMVEAMACGTPVIARRRGSVPEVVDDGVTGFVVDDVAGALEAVRRAAALDRKAVRARAAQRFSRDRMVDDYLRVYERVLAGAGVA
ncbi:MAG TPA: glycosyltransferase family 4 protein [Candidatus Limnocylindria bacterium]|jgi:glycosyltransferase involved in cell wall biosynthesis|nr:glycosyltransferase family 4 protein [Candidatus Limnocylindria bacterium]